MENIFIPKKVAVEELIVLLNQPAYNTPVVMTILKNTFKNIGTVTAIRPIPGGEGTFFIRTQNPITSQYIACYGEGKRESQQIIVKQNSSTEFEITSYNVTGDFYMDVLVNVPIYIQAYNAYYKNVDNQKQ